MSFENYNPSSEEMEKAEEMMTDEQKMMSEVREEGYNIGAGNEPKDPEAPTYEKATVGGVAGERIIAPEKPYAEQKSVNGIDMNVYWDPSYSDYSIYFPQIELGDETYERGISDQVIRISEDPKVAREVLNYAAEVAATESDPSEVYLKVDAYLRRKN